MGIPNKKNAIDFKYIFSNFNPSTKLDTRQFLKVFEDEVRADPHGDINEKIRRCIESSRAVRSTSAKRHTRRRSRNSPGMGSDMWKQRVVQKKYGSEYQSRRAGS